VPLRRQHKNIVPFAQNQNVCLTLLIIFSLKLFCKMTLQIESYKKI